MLKRPAETVVALGLVALAAAAYVASYSVGGGVNAASSDSPMQLPRILLGIWIAFGLLCALRAALLAEPGCVPAVRLAKIAPFAALVVLMVLLLPALGYLIPMTLGIAGLLWLLGERNALRGGVALLLLGPGLWYLFHHVLGLRLPVLLSGGAL